MIGLSSSTRYSVAALCELASLFEGGQFLGVRAIAERRDIPARYLEQLLAQLKQAGLVESARGPAGGFRLSRPAGDIELLEIIEAVEGPVQLASGGPCPYDEVLRRCRDGLRDALRVGLDELVEAELAHRAGSRMMYHI